MLHTIAQLMQANVPRRGHGWLNTCTYESFLMDDFGNMVSYDDDDLWEQSILFNHSDLNHYDLIY